MSAFCCNRVAANRSREAVHTTPLLGGDHGDLMCAFSQWARGRARVSTPHNGRGHMVRLVRYTGCRVRTRAVPPGTIVEWQRYYGLSRAGDAEHVTFRDITAGQAPAGDVLAFRAMRCGTHESYYVMYVHLLVVPPPPPPVVESADVLAPLETTPVPKARVRRSNSLSHFVSHGRALLAMRGHA